MMTPFFPSSFLLLATISNIGKNVAFLANGATGAGIRYGFVNASDIGDITAKEGSQASAVYMVGMFAGVALSSFVGNQNISSLLVMLVCTSVLSLYCTNRSLRCVSLSTLNAQVVAIATFYVEE